MRQIYIVDDEPDACKTLALLVEDAGYRASAFLCGEEMLQQLRNGIPDVILLDRKMGEHMDGLAVLEELGRRKVPSQVIMLTGHADVESAVEAMKRGAYDYVPKPYERETLLHRIKHAIEKKELVSEVEGLKQRLDARDYLESMMGHSAQIRKVHQEIEKVMMTDYSVVIYGETGTGKEIVARAVHDYSLRREKQFVAVDCGAIPENLMESELFGYLKGAFTGAHTTREGRFQQAAGGSIFLDEISNLTYELQKKLLRVVQERKVQKIGSRRLEPVDVRFISASNLPIDELVKKGEFRKDLYFRLDEFTIRIPPLRERRDDIPMLAERFLKNTELQLKQGKRELSPAALGALRNHEWPGNVRELQNVIRRATLISEGSIQPEHLALNLDRAAVSETELPTIDTERELDLKQMKQEFAAVVEKRVIAEVLNKFRGNKSRTARYLKIDYKTLLTKINDYGINSMVSSSKAGESPP